MSRIHLFMSEIKSVYHIDLDVKYSDNTEYRQTLRDLFDMKIDCCELLDDLDEESRDELLFDEQTMSQSMDVLFEQTKDDACFQELYDLAAALFFSTDRGIGQAVLMSYDYLEAFHKCLVCFDKGEMENQQPCFLELKGRLR